MTPVPGFEGRYSVTKDGRVFSHVRKNGFLVPTPDKDGYLAVCLHKNGTQHTPRIHQIMSWAFFGGHRLDHRNRKPADNRISNLRVCSLSTNRINAKINSNNTSGYRGVNWLKDKKRWLARIQVGKKRISLGSFLKAEDAAKAFDVAVIKHFGEFAVTNFAA